LQIVDVVALFQGLERPVGQILVAHPEKSPAFRTEKRLDHHVAPEFLEGGHGLVQAFGHDGLRRGKSRAFQGGQGEILAGAVLDGKRRVDDALARALKAVQGVHPEDDLLQRAAGHGPHEDHIGLVQGVGLAVPAHGGQLRRGAAPAGPGLEAGDGIAGRFHPAPGQGLLEQHDVLAAFFSEDDRFHRPNDLRSKSRVVSPALKVRPVRELAKETWAGLKSRGSIL